MFQTRNRSKFVIYSWVISCVALMVVASPIAASSIPDVVDSSTSYGHTSNATSPQIPLYRDGSYYYFTNGDAEIPAAVETLRAITPEIIGPNGITVNTLMPGFAWASVLGAEQYRFNLYEDPGLTSVVTSINTEIPAVTVPEPLIPGHDYYWTVTVIHPDTSMSSWATFHTATRASIPTVEVVSDEASRPRATDKGVMKVAALSEASVEPVRLEIATVSATPTPQSVPVIPVVIAVGVVLLVLVLTVLLRPYIAD